MKIVKGLLGIAIWIVLGFLIYCLCAGLGAVAYFIFHYMPWYHIVLGTLSGCIAVFLYMIADVKEKKDENTNLSQAKDTSNIAFV